MLMLFVLSLVGLGGDDGAYTYTNQNEPRDVQVFNVQDGTYSNRSGDLVFHLTISSGDQISYSINNGVLSD
jgi:hypothetical protein